MVWSIVRFFSHYNKQTIKFAHRLERINNAPYGYRTFDMSRSSSQVGGGHFTRVHETADSREHARRTCAFRASSRVCARGKATSQRLLPSLPNVPSPAASLWLATHTRSVRILGDMNVIHTHNTHTHTHARTSSGSMISGARLFYGNVPCVRVCAVGGGGRCTRVDASRRARMQRV